MIPLHSVGNSALRCTQALICSIDRLAWERGSKDPQGWELKWEMRYSTRLGWLDKTVVVDSLDRGALALRGASILPPASRTTTIVPQRVRGLEGTTKLVQHHCSFDEYFCLLDFAKFAIFFCVLVRPSCKIKFVIGCPLRVKECHKPMG